MTTKPTAPQYRNVQTPCIGICSTVYGDDICRGCKRTYQEVIDWNAYTPIQKAEVLSRIDVSVSKVCAEYFTVDNLERLKQALVLHHIDFNEDASGPVLACLLLGMAADEIKSAASVGLSIHATYQQVSLRELINDLDGAIYSSLCD